MDRIYFLEKVDPPQLLLWRQRCSAMSEHGKPLMACAARLGNGSV